MALRSTFMESERKIGNEWFIDTIFNNFMFLNSDCSKANTKY